MSNPPDSYQITPQQTLAVAKGDGLTDQQLQLKGLAIMTFSRAVMNRLEELCGLEDAQWLSGQHHPYAAPEVVKKGDYQGLSVTALLPSMGASPMACVVEDLVTCGAEAVFLVCPAWSLGPPVQFGELIIPEFSVGPDGTSIHYGNTSGRVEGNPAVIEALAEACKEREVTSHVGGNASCEAMYRITPQMVKDFRKQGCLCMENGEASTLFAMAQALSFLGGVLFHPYIDLTKGWDPTQIDERYVTACRFQAEVVLDACIRLREQGLIGSD